MSGKKRCKSLSENEFSLTGPIFLIPTGNVTLNEKRNLESRFSHFFIFLFLWGTLTDFTYWASLNLQIRDEKRGTVHIFFMVFAHPDLQKRPFWDVSGYPRPGVALGGTSKIPPGDFSDF